MQKEDEMKIGIMIETREPEKAWNGLRFAITAKKSGHETRVFLMSEGVEVNQIDHPTYDAANKLQDYLDLGGELMACGTCMESRGKEDGATCPMSSMLDFLQIVEWADKTVTF